MGLHPTLHCDECGKEGERMVGHPGGAKDKEGRFNGLEHACTDCYTKLNNGRPSLGLRDLNEIRKRNITEEQYYKEKGYI